MRAIRRSLLREGKRGLWRILLALFLVLLCGIIVLVARYSVRLLPNCIMLYHCVFLNVFYLLYDPPPIKSREDLRLVIAAVLMSVLLISLSLFFVFYLGTAFFLVAAFILDIIIDSSLYRLINF